MSIQSVDQAIAGMQPPRFFHKAITPTLVTGKPQSTWGLAGIPGAGSFDNTLNGVTLSSTGAQVNGQIPFTDPAGGISQYLARFVGTALIQCSILLCDRIWHNGGYTITSNTAQNSTTPTWPARDQNGQTNGLGILLGLEISAAAGAAAPTITISYTNSGGTAGRSGVNAFATANSPAAGSFFPIGLQAGDQGVQSVQSLTLSTSWLSGTMNLVAYRVIAALECINGTGAINILTGGMPQLFNGSVPFIVLIPGTTTANVVAGLLTTTQG